jgi:hypothetical protein
MRVRLFDWGLGQSAPRDWPRLARMGELQNRVVVDLIEWLGRG